jgi:hypothetical protein
MVPVEDATLPLLENGEEASLCIRSSILILLEVL